MKRVWVWAVLALATAPAAAEDLLDIYRLAQQHDPVWAAAQAAQRVTAERVPQAQALRRARIDAYANIAENSQRLKTPTFNDRQDFRSNGYGVELTQPLYRAENAPRNAQAEAAVAQAESELAAARVDLILRTARAYLAVLAAQDTLAHARSEKAAVQRLLALARRNFNVGAASLVDVHDAQAAYDLAVSQEIAADNEYEVRRQALQVLTGTRPGELARLGETLPLTPPPQTIDDWVERAVADNAQVRARERALAQAAQEIDIQRAARRPQLDAVAGRNYSDSTNILGTPTESTVDQVGLLLNVPLYRGGAVDSRVREAAARHDEARAQLETARRSAAQQAREAYLALLNNIAQVRALEQARTSNQRALESTVLGQERGLRSGLDVLNNQRVLFRTRRDLSRARYDYLLTRLQLDAAVGALTDEDLASINQLLTQAAP